MNNDNFSSVLTRYVGLLKIPIAPSALQAELKKHPDYYSMLAYYDVLANYGIQTNIYRVGFTELAKISLPAITHLTNRNYAVITEMTNDYIILADGKRKRKKITMLDFKELYSGVVQVMDTAATPHGHGFENSQSMLLKLKPFGGFIFAVLLIACFLLNSSFLDRSSWSLLSMICLKAFGIFFSCLLLMQSMDANNPLIKKLCTTSEKVDCGAILSSEAAKLTSFLSWSEVGFFYFVGGLFTVLFIPSAVSLLAWINILTLPYTVFSIYYQYRIAKKWCTFCCAIQALLWVEFFTLLPFLTYDVTGIPVLTLLRVLALFALPVAGWFLIKPYLLRLISINAIEDQLRIFKYNRKVFSDALKTNPRIDSPSEHFSIVLGSNEPKHIITMVASPFCNPCAKAHEEIEKALNTIDKLQVRIVFAGNDLTNEDERLQVRRHFIALHHLESPILLRSSLNDWYNGASNNYSHFKEKYPVMFSTHLDTVLAEQQQWVKLHKITQTPTILINGYQMPPAYLLHETKYLLDE